MAPEKVNLDRVIKTEADLSVSFLDQVAGFFGGDREIAECWLGSYNYHLDCLPSAASEEAVLNYLERFLPSNAPY